LFPNPFYSFCPSLNNACNDPVFLSVRRGPSFLLELSIFIQFIILAKSKCKFAFYSLCLLYQSVLQIAPHGELVMQVYTCHISNNLIMFLPEKLLVTDLPKTFQCFTEPESFSFYSHKNLQLGLISKLWNSVHQFIIAVCHSLRWEQDVRCWATQKFLTSQHPVWNHMTSTSKRPLPTTDNFKNEGFNPLNVELNPICHFLALLGPHPIFHVSRIRVNNSFHYFYCNFIFNLVIVIFNFNLEINYI